MFVSEVIVFQHRPQVEGICCRNGASSFHPVREDRYGYKGEDESASHKGMLSRPVLAIGTRVPVGLRHESSYCSPCCSSGDAVGFGF